jgi:hypothetical protein
MEEDLTKVDDRDAEPYSLHQTAALLVKVIYFYQDGLSRTKAVAGLLE